MEWALDATSSASSATALESVSWAYTVGCFVLFLAVIYLMCHTADNFFSPVLAVMCDLLDMPPEVAGVTFLAFGNGAPDVFSAFVALTTSGDREEGLLVGMGSLLGSTISTVTLIIGCVVYVKPAEVSRVPFTRDVAFLVVALLLVLFSASQGRISIWMASCYLALYGAYVTIVLKGPAAGGGKGAGDSIMSSQDGLEVGELGCGVDEHAVHARWIGGATLPLPSLEAELPRKGSNFAAAGSPRHPFDTLHKSNGVARGGDEGDAFSSGAGGGGGSSGDDRDRRRAPSDSAGPARGRTPARDEFSARGHSVRHDYFGGEEGDGEGGGGERRSLLRGDGEEGEGGVLAMVPGSTVSMFLEEEDDSAASWMARGRWGLGGSAWGGQAASGYGASSGMSEPLLQGRSSPGRSRGGAQNGHDRNAHPGGAAPGASGGAGVVPESSLVARRFEHAWATIRWRQWRLRRRVRRELGNSHVLQLPLYRRLFWALELPFIIVRNATIPPVEADSWSQMQAAISTALAPSLMVWAFGQWSTSIVWGLTFGWVAFLGGLPAGVAVWLTTHKRRMPRDRWYRLGLALVSFGSCVAWIYYFADAAVNLIDELGTATGIPASVLGLTLLAWGNSSGDLVTNLAVARAGFPGMAIAGSYGGPLFNILLGVGLPMFYSCARYYPTEAVFELDLSTIFTACMVVLVLAGTLPAVARSGFRFPDKAPLALLGVYAVYMAGAVYFTLTFQA